MLFNLGLTADAAAAHETTSNSLPSRPNSLSTSSSPSISLASLPWGSRHKRPDSHHGGRAPSTTRPMSVDHPGSPALDHSAALIGSASAALAARSPATIDRTQSVRKPPSSRPKTIYQLAHPASHARHIRLKLRPRLLLQLQRVSQTPRPLPVLDVLPSTVFLPRLARKFPTIFRGKKGLGPNDLIVVNSDLYDRNNNNSAERSTSSDDENGEHREVVATVCQIFKEDALAKGKAEICLSNGPVWEATPLANGSYEFVANTEHGIRTLRWVLRGPKNARRLSAPPGPGSYREDVVAKRFTFSVIDPATRRHPVIATMTRNHLEVFEEYSLPSATAAPSPTSAMSVNSDVSESETPNTIGRKPIPVDEHLRMLIVVTSIWVAFREGWSHNFRYDDSALVLNSKAICAPIASSRHHSPASPKVEKENNRTPTSATKDIFPEGPFHGPRSRVPTAATLPPSSPSSSPNKSMGYGSLTRRSNSTGAAFMERTNRRAASASGANGAPSRHSMLPSARELSRSKIPEAHTPPPDSESASGSPQRRQTRYKKNTPHNVGTEKTGSALEAGTLRNTGDRTSTSRDEGPVKGKRRHRLSNIFDFLVRKHH